MKPSADEKADKLSEWEREAAATVETYKMRTPDAGSVGALMHAKQVLKLIAAVRKYREAETHVSWYWQDRTRAEAEAILAGEGADAE